MFQVQTCTAPENCSKAAEGDDCSGTAECDPEVVMLDTDSIRVINSVLLMYVNAKGEQQSQESNVPKMEK